MAEQDLEKFIEKVETLVKMVESLESLPERREALTACNNHDEVVELARTWGYEIGRRWGD